MTLEYSKHAQRRMSERGMAASEIEEAHARPVTEDSPGSGNGTLTFVGCTRGARRLKIVVLAADRNYIVSVWEA